jgi:hypothetical protein
MGQRSGATLVEVLVAIFVTSIGLLGMLALFPLGVLNMARALQEERAAEACANAIAVAKVIGRDSNGNVIDLRKDVTVTPYLTAPPNPLVPGNAATVLPTRAAGPSYPVLVDPVGVYNYGGTLLGTWVGRTSTTDPATVPRVNPWPATGPYGSFVQAIQACSLLDDLTFGSPFDGTPHPSGSSLIQRDERYSWAYLVRKPSIAAPPEIVDLSVVVYNGRQLQSGTGIADEANYQAILTAPNLISLTWSGQKPSIRKGGWVLDATVASDPPRGYFYRVTNVTDTSPNSMNLETQTNLIATGSAVIVIMQNVVEVFDRAAIPGAP